MSAADDAFAAAEAEIEKARVEGSETLDLAYKQFAALERLPDSIGRLDKLRMLVLGKSTAHVAVTDLSPLSGLTGLTRLSLNNSQVTDLSPLSGLTGLTGLYLDNSQVTDLSPLSGLAGLTGLDLDNSQVTDLSPLSGLTGLTKLWLNNSQVTDLSPLSGLTGLTGLSLNNSQVTDLSPLSGLTGLTVLWLNNSQVTDLSPLSGLTGLTVLYLNNSQVTDLSPLSGLTGLTELDLSNSQVTDLSPLSGLTGLTELDLSNNQVTDLSPLSGLTGLTGLDLSNSQVTDLSPLSGLIGLRELWLANSRVTDLRPIGALRQFAVVEGRFGLTFSGCDAAQADARIADIAEIENGGERAAALFAYLEDWVPPVPGIADIEEVLKGPVLASSLVDVQNTGTRFEAVAMADGAARERDRAHDEMVATLAYGAGRLGRTETQNRLGTEIAESLRDYSVFVGHEPLNAPLLIYLAQGIRAVMSDDTLAEALDGFDAASLSGFMQGHDRLIRVYYPHAKATPQIKVETDPEVLQREVFPKLQSARDLIAKADADGLFAPSVSSALEILHRRAEGARKRIMLSDDPEEREAAVADLRDTTVLATAYLGRIKGRVQQWLDKEAKHARENPGDATLKAVGLFEVAKQAIAALTPVFEALWRLVGNLPLPF